jgi:hypothetical protein
VKQLEFNIPGAAISYNYLYENMPIDWREEDLLFVRLPNGNAIDVGWYPACDPTGRFKITLSDSTQNQIEAGRVHNLDQVVGAVEGLALGSMQRIVLPTIDVVVNPSDDAVPSPVKEDDGQEGSP